MIEFSQLIYFDSEFFLPACIPLIHIDPTDQDASYGRVGFDLLNRFLSEETNRDDVIRFMNPPLFANAHCACGALITPCMKGILNHIFSRPHMDKYMRARGSISRIDFNFWKEVFVRFPNVKRRALTSNEDLTLELWPFPCLHDRDIHWIVEVFSEEERETALCNFISYRLLREEKAVVYVGDSKEANAIMKVIQKHLPGVNAGIAPEQLPCSVVVSHPQVNAGHALIFLRPPKSMRSSSGLVMVNDDKCGDCYVPGFVAFMQALDTTSSTIMFIRGSEEMAVFREFEKKFAHTGDFAHSHPQLPIYSSEQMKKKADANVTAFLATALAEEKRRKRKERKKNKKKKKSTVAKPETSEEDEEEEGNQEAEVNEPLSTLKDDPANVLSIVEKDEVTEEAKIDPPTPLFEDVVKVIQKSSATELSKRQQRALELRRKREKAMKGAGKVQQTCLDNFDVPTIEDDGEKVKERSPMFIPFDEVTGKAVGEWIEWTLENTIPPFAVKPIPIIEMEWGI